MQQKITVKKQIELVTKWFNQRLKKLGDAAADYDVAELEQVPFWLLNDALTDVTAVSL